MNLKFHATDTLQAGPDVVRLLASASAGQQPRLQHVHPLAEEIKLRDVALAAGMARPGPGKPSNELALLALGISSPMFSDTLADGIRPELEAAYTDGAEYLPACRIIEVSNFREHPLLHTETDLQLRAVPEGGEPQSRAFIASIDSGRRTARLVEHKVRALLSRHAIYNDQLGEWAYSVIALGKDAARIEGGMLAAALAANGDLEDGRPIFGADNKVEQALSDTSLATAMQKLRNQPLDNGQDAGLRAKFLMVASDVEYKAHKLVRDAGLDIRVVVLTALPEGRWYLLADPVAAPTVGVLRLGGARVPVRVESAKAPSQYDGAVVSVTADLGAAVIGRLGIVQGGSN